MNTVERTEVDQGLVVRYKTQPGRPYWYLNILEVNRLTFPDGQQALQIINHDGKGHKRTRTIMCDRLLSALYALPFQGYP